MKKLIFVLMLTVQMIHSTSMSSEMPFDCLIGKQASADVMVSIRKTAYQILEMHPELALSVGAGWCLDLNKTSALSIAAGEVNEHFPEKCMGLTFLASGKEDLRARARLTVNTQSNLIDGTNGAALIQVGQQMLKLPICMESFEGGGPQ